jgi:hypothetical protein
VGGLGGVGWGGVVGYNLSLYEIPHASIQPIITKHNQTGGTIQICSDRNVLLLYNASLNDWLSCIAASCCTDTSPHTFISAVIAAMF